MSGIWPQANCHSQQLEKYLPCSSASRHPANHCSMTACLCDPNLQSSHHQQTNFPTIIAYPELRLICKPGLRTTPQTWLVACPSISRCSSFRPFFLSPANHRHPLAKSALFNFQSLLLVVLLLICTSAYVHHFFPGMMDKNKNGFMGIFWKCARVGERLSPYISICCVLMAVRSPGPPSPDPDRLPSRRWLMAV